MAIKSVITGDLIGSRNVPSGTVSAAMAVLEQEARLLDALGLGLDTKFTRYRGDGWQIVLDDPGLSLVCCVRLFAALRAANLEINTRMSVGLGTVTTHGTASLADADGEAFVVSGGHLDNIGNRRMVIAGKPAGHLHDAVFALTEAVIGRWSQLQAEAVHRMLSSTNKTQQEVAEELGITRQAVQLRLSGADYGLIATAMTDFQKAMNAHA